MKDEMGGTCNMDGEKRNAWKGNLKEGDCLEH